MICIIIAIVLFLFSLYCLKVKQPNFLHRLKLNLSIALLFCYEAGKFLFSSSSSSNNPHSISTSPTDTTKHPHQSSSIPIADYQSSEYYINDTAINCHTTQSIYDDNDNDGKSIYSLDDDDGLEESEYTTRYDRCLEGDTCWEKSVFVFSVHCDLLFFVQNESLVSWEFFLFL